MQDEELKAEIAKLKTTESDASSIPSDNKKGEPAEVPEQNDESSQSKTDSVKDYKDSFKELDDEQNLK